VYLPNAYSQAGLHRSYRADGTITTSNVAQLLLPLATSRAMLMVMNIGAAAMYIDHGPPRATAQITNGQVTGFTITNGGFNYTLPPTVQLAGGGIPFVHNANWNGIGLRNVPAPTGMPKIANGVTTFARPAKAHAVLTGGVVTSIVIDDPGAGYINPPEVVFENQPEDPFGCADAYYGTKNNGIYLAPTGGSYSLNGTACWTDAISIVGTAGNAFTVEYMP
jgi:hypothetical protein